MSSLLDAIASELGPTGLPSLGEAAGATPDQAQTMFSAALPLLVKALSHNASTGGASSLATALDRHHTPSLLDALGPLAGSLLGGGSASGGVGSLLGAALGHYPAVEVRRSRRLSTAPASSGTSSAADRAARPTPSPEPAAWTRPPSASSSSFSRRSS